MRILFSFVLTFSLIATACVDDTYAPDPDGAHITNDAGADSFPDALVTDQFVPPDGFTLGKEVVYAHTPDKLFKIDPQTLSVKEVGDFKEDNSLNKPVITDLAIDKTGQMIAVSKSTVYSVDLKTAVCTELSSAKASYVGLSYVVNNKSIDKSEYLMGLGKDGKVYDIDPKTGTATQVGSLGDDPVDTGTPLKAAGDVVSIRGFMTLATIERPKTVGEDTDWLAKIDPMTGKATIIGKVGYKGVWGLGFWKHDGENKVFGFTNTGDFLLINVQTGKGTLQNSDATKKWWGAGVTTDAPTID